MTIRSYRASVLRFGEIARRLGFISEDELSDALDKQKARADQGMSHKLLGLILLELGYIDNEQLIQILKEYEVAERGRTCGTVPQSARQ